MPRQGVSTTAARRAARAGLALALASAVVASAVAGVGVPLDVATGSTPAAPVFTDVHGVVEPLAGIMPPGDADSGDLRRERVEDAAARRAFEPTRTTVTRVPVTSAPVHVAPVDVAPTEAVPVAAVPTEPVPAEQPTAPTAPTPPAAAVPVAPAPVPDGPAQVEVPAPLPPTPDMAMLAPGTVKPDASNTGVPPGTPLRVVVGDLDVTTPGTVIDSIDLRGFLRVKAANVTVSRSIIRGGPAVRVEGVVTVTPAATNFVITDSEVYPSSPSVMLDGIKGANFTARRINVHGGVDNIKVHGSNVLIESSYLHDQEFYASDPLQNGGATHNDALQILGGDRISVVGNTLLGSRDLNAAVQVTQDFAPVTRLELLKNWIDGGGCSVNINHKKLTELRDVVLRENVLGRNTRYGNCGVILTTQTFPTLLGNTYTDGVAVTPKYMAPV